MHRGLFWALLATVAASAATLWVERQAPVLVAAVERTRVRTDMPVARGPEGLAVALPTRLAPVTIEPFQRDLFVPVQSAVPKPVSIATPPPALPVGPPPTPPLPSAPAFKARFLGRMVTPAGDTLVFLTTGDKTVLAQPGDVLDDGYVVDSVTPQAVVVRYPSLDVKVTLPLPLLPAP